jgi:hypothetical protein
MGHQLEFRMKREEPRQDMNMKGSWLWAFQAFSLTGRSAFMSGEQSIQLGHELR